MKINRCKDIKLASTLGGRGTLPSCTHPLWLAMLVEWCPPNRILLATVLLQSTYPVRCIYISLLAGTALIFMYVVVDDLYLRMLGKLCTWAESTWPAVGTVDRHGQQKRTICDACGPCQRNWSILKPVFFLILMDSLCLRVTQMPRSWEVAIFVPLMTTDDRWRW